jgi:hypothetical protein
MWNYVLNETPAASDDIRRQAIKVKFGKELGLKASVSI